MVETVRVPGATAPTGIVRGALTWHLYLLLGFFQIIINLQGNILPFLRAEFDLSYRMLGFHPSALACGTILVGLIAPRIIRRFGRRRMLMFGVAGFASAAVLLCLAPVAPLSIASFALLGLCAPFIMTIIFSTLADVHGEKRTVAFNECTAVASIFGIFAPLLMGLCLSVGFGWRSAVLIGVAFGVALLASFTRVASPEPSAVAMVSRGVLSPTYWAYWTALALGVATEFCILLWAPTYLESVIGLSAASAATAAVAFALAMAVGRIAGSRLVRVVAVPPLFVATVGVTLAGFLLYWGIGNPIVAVAGLFIVGLGISLIYPLVFSQAVGAAPGEGDKASARITIAAGIAVLTMPALLGELAGRFGLQSAHLLVPLLVTASLAAFSVARMLERRSAAIA